MGALKMPIGAVFDANEDKLTQKSMAEINIEKKSPKWPWILLAIIIIGVIIYLFAFNEEDEDNEVITEETTEEPLDTRQNALNNGTVAAFVSLIEQDPDPMGLDHEFTNEALSKLIDATQSMANEINYDIQRDIDQVETLAQKITEDPFETTHANSIKEAAGILAQSLQNMQQKSFSGLANEADQVKSAATDIQVDVLTLDQKEQVKNFFRESADLLDKMNNNSPEI